MLRMITAFLLAMAAATLQAAVVGKEVSYQAGDTVMKGYLVYDDAVTGKRPGILVVHEWWGHNAYARKRADMLAELELEALSPVVEAPDGFHIFQVLARRAGGEYTYEEIEGQLRQFLENQKFEEAYGEWLTAVRDTSYVEIKTWTR